MSLLDPLIASLRTRLTKLERSYPRPREGTVTQSHPMQVRLDGDSVDTPVRQIAHASVGSRVLCMKLGFRYYVMGQIGGQGSMLLDEVNMDGQDMPGGSGHTLHIPPALQGTFRSYTVEVMGGVSGGLSHGANEIGRASCRERVRSTVRRRRRSCECRQMPRQETPHS